MEFFKTQNSYRADDTTKVRELMARLAFAPEQQHFILQQAQQWITEVRKQADRDSFFKKLMTTFSLDKEEGLLLMSLAEALIRVPDRPTQDLLIQDKLGQRSLGGLFSDHSSVMARLTEKLLNITHYILKNKATGQSENIIKKSLKKSTAPVIRETIYQTLGHLANIYVMAPTIEQALDKSQHYSNHYKFSFDMLGEAALTNTDADKFYKNYCHAVTTLSHLSSEVKKRNSISIKLSALHPRYEILKRDQVMAELYPKLAALCHQAAAADIMLTIDAEECDRLELSLFLIEKLAWEFRESPWQGLGLAVQAYQKRALQVIEGINELGKAVNRRFNIRLVKGAYWDSEIKWAQEKGLADYPVYTSKVVTDLSYLACAQTMLNYPNTIFPSFATHNAHTIAAIQYMTQTYQRDYEFQALYGMGHKIYDYLCSQNLLTAPVRFYAPIGHHRDLLPYLVRRLLENGANSSFVNSFLNTKIPVAEVVTDPLDVVKQLTNYRHVSIPLPINLFSNRPNSQGFDFSSLPDQKKLYQFLNQPLTKIDTSKKEIVRSPIDQSIIGSYDSLTPDELNVKMDTAALAFKSWGQTLVHKRAECARKLAQLFEQNTFELIRLCVMEAGKTAQDSVAEIREAVDFCYYYANEAERLQRDPINLPGITGEQNQLLLQGRGVFVCISPWNFPLAIFTGQTIAALVSGNTVIAKPSGLTVLIAEKAVQLMHQAGFPFHAVQLAPASGSVISESCLRHPQLSGVCFTGSTETARHINIVLANRAGTILPLIAETGGQNAMIVDSTALPEQVVKDVIMSAFQSAGQRCSAARVLLLQQEIADTVITMLTGAMQQLSIGDPRIESTDVGPLINVSAQEELSDYMNNLPKNKIIYQCELSSNIAIPECYFAPVVVSIDQLSDMKKEHFGPILHILTYQSHEFDSMLEAVNQLGYGLTFGLQTRLNHRMQAIQDHLHVGNIYINRSTIGAVVESQPFGGQGLSGTGPKAGGPHYLLRFMHEKTVTINTTAQGGNASLMTL